MMTALIVVGILVMYLVGGSITLWVARKALGPADKGDVGVYMIFLLWPITLAIVLPIALFGPLIMYIAEKMEIFED